MYNPFSSHIEKKEKYLECSSLLYLLKFRVEGKLGFFSSSLVGKKKLCGRRSSVFLSVRRRKGFFFCKHEKTDFARLGKKNVFLLTFFSN